MPHNDVLCTANVRRGEAGLCCQLDAGCKPELRFTVRMGDVNMFAFLLAGEEEQPERTFTQHGR